jgi:hypothetical protein
MTARQKLLITKGRTYISLGLVISGVAGILWAYGDYTHVKAQVEQNSRDIETVFVEMRDLKQELKATNNNLNITNENLVRANTLLERK